MPTWSTLLACIRPKQGENGARSANFLAIGIFRILWSRVEEVPAVFVSALRPGIQTYIPNPKFQPKPQLETPNPKPEPETLDPKDPKCLNAFADGLLLNSALRGFRPRCWGVHKATVVHISVSWGLPVESHLQHAQGGHWAFWVQDKRSTEAKTGTSFMATLAAMAHLGCQPAGVEGLL